MKTLKFTRTALLSLVALMGVGIAANSYAKAEKDQENISFSAQQTTEQLGTLRILPLNATHIEPRVHTNVKEERALNFVRTLTGQGLTVSYNHNNNPEADIVVTFTLNE